MALLAELASVSPDANTQPFWDACQKRELRLQRCADCGRFRQPPLPGCARCGSKLCDWPLLSGAGTVFSYTVVHHAAVPSLAATVPYNVVVVELDDCGGVMVPGNVVDCDPDEVHVGMRVEVVFERLDDEVTIPRFRRVT